MINFWKRCEGYAIQTYTAEAPSDSHLSPLERDVSIAISPEKIA